MANNLTSNTSSIVLKKFLPGFMSDLVSCKTVNRQLIGDGDQVTDGIDLCVDHVKVVVIIGTRIQCDAGQVTIDLCPVACYGECFGFIVKHRTTTSASRT